MHRLDPACLFGFGVNTMRRRRFEQHRGTVPDQADQACAGLTVTRFNIVRIRPGKRRDDLAVVAPGASPPRRSEEHTSELQSLMRISYAVFCLQKKKNNH